MQDGAIAFFFMDWRHMAEIQEGRCLNAGGLR